MARVLGRKCKLGYGYNEYLNLLAPFPEESFDVSSNPVNQWNCFYSKLTSTEIGCWPGISLFLESSYKKDLDFNIIFDNNEYWTILCQFIRRKEGCKKIPSYPSKYNHFVNQVYYGVDFWIQLPKAEFSRDAIDYVFSEKILIKNEIIGCRVMINYNKFKEISLKELIKFMKELDEGKHSEYDIPVRFEYEKFPQESQNIVINNKLTFTFFLTYLHCIYRKIEIKMEKAGYPDILPNLNYEEKSLVNVCTNLGRAKEAYVAMNKDDFLQMYPVLKELFFRYVHYIKYSIDHKIDIDEGDNLLGTTEEIATWLKHLNDWFPIEINGKWTNCMNSFIGTPDGFNEIVNTLHKTDKFKNSVVIKDNNVDECYICEESDKILFGLVNMEEANKDQICNNPNPLQLECLENCSPHLRRWVCRKCGEYIRSMVSSVEWLLLFCSCGSKKYRDKLLICHHPSHRTHPSVPDTEAMQREMSNDNNQLQVICQQLQKMKMKKETVTDPKICKAIDCLKNNGSEEEIKNALRDLKDVVFDGDTRHSINQYLN